MSLTQLQSTDNGSTSMGLINAAISKADSLSKPCLIVGTDTTADYVCDGTADEVQINAALTALGASGGMVFIKAGTYNTADDIIIPEVDNISLIGAGMGATIISMGTASTFDGIKKVGTSATSNLTIANLTVDGNRPDGSVVGLNNIYVGNVTNLVMENVKEMDSRGNGLALAGCIEFKLSNVISTNSNYVGIWAGDYSATHSVRGYFVNCQSSSHALDNWTIVDECNNMQFVNCKSYSSGTAGFYLGPDASFCAFTNCWAVSNTTSGWDLGDRANYNTFSSCHAISNTQAGFATAGANNTFSSCVAYANGWDGFYISGVQAGEADMNIVTGCSSRGNTGYGVKEVSLGANPNRTIVTSCNLLSNTGGTYSFLGAQSIQANNILA